MKRSLMISVLAVVIILELMSCSATITTQRSQSNDAGEHHEPLVVKLKANDLPDGYNLLVKEAAGTVTFNYNSKTQTYDLQSFMLNLKSGDSLLLESNNATTISSLMTAQNTDAIVVNQASQLSTQIHAGTAALLNGYLVNTCDV